METKKYSRQSRNIIFKCLVLFIMVSANGSAWAEIIPAARIITWQGNVGVSGGIPARTTICATINNATYGDGVTNATSTIQTAINNCTVGQVVYLPPGTYLVSSVITIAKGITLRGAGRASTVILNNSDIGKIVMMGVESANGTAVNISSGYTKGSTAIVMADASGFAIGDYIGIDEINDASIPVTTDGFEGACNWCGRGGGGPTRARGQALKITGKTGNTLTVTPPLYFTFSGGNTPQAYKVLSITENAGLEDLTVQNGTGTYNNSRVNIELFGTANSWVKNVKVEKCGQRCFYLFGNNYKAEIRDSYAHECFNHKDSNQCYGLILGFNTSACLIENNIFDTVSEGPMLSWGTSGNVVGYNHVYDSQRHDGTETTWFLDDMWSHGAHSSFNLHEGNQIVGIGSDQIWGSHSHNTYFRNRILGKSPAITYGTTSGVSTITFQKNSHYMNVIGNVLGTTGWTTVYEREGADYSLADKLIYQLGYIAFNDTTAAGNDAQVKATLYRHGNWDAATDSVIWDGGNGDHTIPNSLYLASKPSWWCNETPWPPIGSDLSPMTSDIPAKRIYLGAGCTTGTTPPPPTPPPPTPPPPTPPPPTPPPPTPPPPTPPPLTPSSPTNLHMM